MNDVIDYGDGSWLDEAARVIRGFIAGQPLSRDITLVSSRAPGCIALHWTGGRVQLLRARRVRHASSARGSRAHRLRYHGGYFVLSDA